MNFTNYNSQKKMYKVVSSLLIFGSSVLVTNNANAQVNLKDLGGKLAVVADGNYRDTDDIGGTVLTLAILKAAGKDDKLVHYTHSCDLVANQADFAPQYTKFPKEHNRAEMAKSCVTSKTKFKGFPNVTEFFDAINDKQAAINDLSKHIQNAHRNVANKLCIIEAGEPDIIFDALDKAAKALKVTKIKNISIVTHHVANDKADAPGKNLSDIITKFGVTKLAVPDQNNLLRVPLSDWNWAKNSKSQNIKYIYDRGFAAQDINQVNLFKGGRPTPAIVGFMDVSDAGMIYYWMSGNKNPSTNDMKVLLEASNSKLLKTSKVTEKVDVAEEVAKENLSVFPNPSNTGVFNLSKKVEWNIHNSDGSKILEGKGEQIDLSSYSKGIYIMNSGDSKIKIVIE